MEKYLFTFDEIANSTSSHNVLDDIIKLPTFVSITPNCLTCSYEIILTEKLPVISNKLMIT